MFKSRKAAGFVLALLPVAVLSAELPYVNFQDVDQSVMETVGDVSITLSLTELSDQDVSVRVIFDVGSRVKMGADLLYTNPLSVLIPSGAQSASFNVTFLDDKEPEVLECLMLALEGVDGPALVGPMMEHTVYVIDDDYCSPAIDPVPSVMCEQDAPVTLSGMPPWGTFSGPGVAGGMFDPASVGTGLHSIVYSVLGPGCSAAVTQVVEVVEQSAACGTRTLTLTRADHDGMSIKVLNESGEEVLPLKEAGALFDPLTDKLSLQLQPGRYDLLFTEDGRETRVTIDLE